MPVDPDQDSPAARRAAILAAYQASGGNKAEAARRTGYCVKTVRKILTRAGLSQPIARPAPEVTSSTPPPPPLIIQPATTQIFLPEPATVAGGPALPDPVELNFEPIHVDTPGTWLLLMDVHMPYHDRRTVELAIDEARRRGVVGVLLNGDILDCAEVSEHERDPDSLDLADEIRVGRQFLGWLRSRLPAARVIYKEGNHECFDDQTEILTNSGWRHHADIGPDSLVASYNAASGMVEFAKPLSIIRRPHAGEMMRLRTRGQDLCVTPNHRMLYRPGGSGPNGKWRIDPFEEMALGDNRAVFVAAGASGKPDADISDDAIRIAAWVLTDGSLKHPSNVVIYQRSEKVHLITDILDRLGWPHWVKVRNRKVAAICGRKLIKEPQPQCEVFLRAGPGSPSELIRRMIHDKSRLPAWVHDLSDRQFSVFLSSFVDGDGSRHKQFPTSWMVYGLKPMMDDLQAACFSHGWRASLSRYRVKDWRLNVTPHQTIAVDRIGRRVGREWYEGTVWCVTTHNDTVVVRRNGRISVTGNCRLPRYILKNAPALFALQGVGLHAWLGLSETGIEWVPDKKVIQLGKLNVIHGHEYRGGAGSSVNPARGLYLKARSVALCGHHHRTSEHHARNIRDQHEAAWSVGCACYLHPRWLPLNDWNLGFAFVHVEPDGNFMVENRRVLNGKIV